MSETSAADARRSMLVGVKLRALVGDHTGEAVDEAVSFAPGSAVLHGGEAWVLIDDHPHRRLGAAIAWAVRSGATALHLIADRDTGVLARRAAAFEYPVSVWHSEGRTLLPAVAEPAAVPLPASSEHEAFRERIAEGGADPLVEHGVLVGEVRGLEVCRVVDDEALGVTRLEVGVGAHDREAFQMLHGDVPTAESLARVADEVRRHREVGAPQHPLNRLGAERFLRWRVERDPAIVAMDRVSAEPPPVVRTNLKDPTPCVALGRDADRAATIVFASGVDLDLVPFAADARIASQARSGADAGDRLVIVLPARDRVGVLSEIAGCLRHPAEFVSLDQRGSDPL